MTAFVLLMHAKIYIKWGKIKVFKIKMQYKLFLFVSH